MQVALVTVGDELLAGDTVNTNAAWLGERLAQRGVSVDRTVVVPDDVDAIREEVGRLAERYDAVLVTGGVGPTHDDVTMDGVAAAFDRSVGEHDGAVAYFDRHDTYAAEDLTEGTTHLPVDARLLENPDGVAPGAVVENVYVLPGVPDEMRGMFATGVPSPTSSSARARTSRKSWSTRPRARSSTRSQSCGRSST